jgi:RNA polymerase sigma factor (sigma-70 family)
MREDHVDEHALSVSASNPAHCTSGTKCSNHEHGPNCGHEAVSILRSEQDFDVVASCFNGIESLQTIRDLSPDIALLDASIPIALGINVLASAISEESRTRIVLLASPTELQSIFAVANGAYGIIPRNVLPEVLIYDLRQVAAGRRLSIRVSRPGEASTTADTSEKALAGLTKREREIVRLVSAGLPNKEVGRQLNLTAGTVKVHLHNIFSKLAINNRTALTALAVSDRYIPRLGPRHCAPSVGRLGAGPLPNLAR